MSNSPEAREDPEGSRLGMPLERSAELAGFEGGRVSGEDAEVA